MSVDISDLIPKPFMVKVKDKELTCQPLRLSHALTLSKVGSVFQDVEKATAQDIKDAEDSLDAVIGELIPEFSGVKLDMNTSVSLLQQMMQSVEPVDNKELREKGVQLSTDPKA